MAAVPFPDEPADHDATRPLRAAPHSSPEAVVAFERLCTAYSERLRRLASTKLSDSNSVDDIVQETLWRAYRAGLHLEEPGQEWPWLSTVAYRLCLDAARDDRLRTGAVALDRAPSHALVSHFGDPEDEELARRRREGIAQALAALPARYRRLLVGRLRGVSIAQLAAAEQISGDATKSIVRRARRLFRQRYALLAEKGGFGAAAGTQVLRVADRVAARVRDARDRLGARWIGRPTLQSASELLTSVPAWAATAAAAVLLGSTMLGGGEPGSGGRAVLGTPPLLTEAGVQVASGVERQGAHGSATVAGLGVDSSVGGPRRPTSSPPPEHLAGIPTPDAGYGPLRMNDDVIRVERDRTDGEDGDRDFTVAGPSGSVDLDGDGRAEDGERYNLGNVTFECPPPGERPTGPALVCPFLLGESPESATESPAPDA